MLAPIRKNVDDCIILINHPQNRRAARARGSTNLRNRGHLLGAADPTSKDQFKKNSIKNFIIISEHVEGLPWAV